MKEYKMTNKFIWVHVLLIGVGVGLVTLPMHLIKRARTKLIIDGNILHGEQGRKGKDTMSTRLSDVISVRVNQTGLLQRMLNYGDVVIGTAGSQYVYEKMDNPEQIKEDILQIAP